MDTTEQLIMAAAEAEFLEKGFAATKTTAIAQRAGVTHAMLHYYFRTKENLFNQVFEKKIRLLAGSFTTILDSELPFREKLQQGISAHFDFIAANPRLPLFILREIVDNPGRQATCREVLLPVFKGVIARLQGLLEEERARGMTVKGEAVEVVLQMVSMNVFTVLSLPIYMMLTETREEDRAAFLETRKEEIVRQVLARFPTGNAREAAV
jgi:AcrR family transcriptional regulator